MPAPKRSRRWLFWLIAPLTLLIVGAIGIALLSRDEPPPDVSDLIVVPRAIPDDQNAILLLSAAAARVDRSAWADDQDLFYDMSRGKNWDAAKAVAWLAANDHVWPDVIRAAKLPLSQAPIMKSLHEVASPQLGPLRELAQLAKIRARHLSRNGEREAALAWLATNLHAAHHVEDSRAGLIIWMGGIALHGMARQSIEEFSRETSITSEAARHLIGALETTRPSAPGLADPIRNENILGKLALEAVLHPFHPSEIEGEFDSLFAAAQKFPLLFKRHRTERIHGNLLRKYVSLVDADLPTLNAAESDIDDLLGRGWRRWNPDNAAGRAVLAVITPTFRSLILNRLRAQSAISATQALLAVRVYEIEHGSLPEKLSDLVPNYLAAVPVDYYDRAPIRYSRSARAIWSVGKNALTVEQLDSELEPSEVVLRIPKPTL